MKYITGESIPSIFIFCFLTATYFLSEIREQAAKEEVEITDQFRLELEQSYKEEQDKRAGEIIFYKSINT